MIGYRFIKFISFTSRSLPICCFPVSFLGALSYKTYAGARPQFSKVRTFAEAKITKKKGLWVRNGVLYIERGSFDDKVSKDFHFFRKFGGKFVNILFLKQFVSFLIKKILKKYGVFGWYICNFNQKLKIIRGLWVTEHYFQGSLGGKWAVNGLKHVKSLT